MPNNPNPLISIISINYNATEVTRAFLQACHQLDYPNFEVILVDNASTVNPEEEIKRDFPEVIFVRSDHNLGFAGGNNLGLEKANGDYFFFINNDTEFPADLLNRMLEGFALDKEVGMVCPKIKFYSQPDIIQYAGFHLMHPITCRTWHVGGKEKDEGQYDKPRETYGAHGAAMMIQKDALARVGAMHNAFFLYYEEWDWSTRIRNQGYKIYYQPGAVVYHKESISIGKLNPLKTYYLTRNRIYYMRRNARAKNLILFWVYMLMFAYPKNALVHLLKFEFKHFMAFTNGVLWNFFHK